MKDKWSIYNEGNLFLIHSREYHLIKLLKYFNLYQLKDKKILEVGCGTAFELRNFLRYGAESKNLYGLDKDYNSIKIAKSKSGGIFYKVSDARLLPYKDKVFDIIIAFVLFSSVTSKEDRLQIAKEMIRVLKDDGLIIFYDFFIRNPQNKSIKAVRKKDIRELFNCCSFYFKRITFLPPVCRILPSFLLIFYYIFESLKIFNTHYIVGIKRLK